MFIRRILLLVILLSLGGCVVGYTLVEPGPVSVQDLQVSAGSGWNLAPATTTPAARNGAQTWTQDGLLLNRLVLIPAVPDGETLLLSRSDDAALPPFRKDMLPNELEELMESSIVKYFGEGQAAVNSANLRPQTFGNQRGVMFDIDAQLTDSPNYKGTIGAFIANEKLYTIWYIAADPYYHAKHQAEADAIIRSAKLVE